MILAARAHRRQPGCPTRHNVPQANGCWTFVVGRGNRQSPSVHHLLLGRLPRAILHFALLASWVAAHFRADESKHQDFDVVHGEASVPTNQRPSTPPSPKGFLFPTAAEPDGKATTTSEPSWRSGTHHLTFDGRDRTFMLDVPRNLKPGAPLVMVFHGFTGSAKDVREVTGFAKVSEAHGFVAVYPQGTRDSKGRTFFNVGYEFHRDQTVDDVRFARGLAARLTRDLGLDPRAVFATGFSNGGDLSFFLGAQREPFVAAIAPVAGTMMQSWAKGFRPAARIPVLAVNIRDDQTTLWDGDINNRDGWGAYLGTEAVMDLWVNGLALERSERTNAGKTVQLRHWSTASDSTEARLYALEAGGHHWPRTLGNESGTTAETIWRFFDAHRPKGR